MTYSIKEQRELDKQITEVHNQYMYKDKLYSCIKEARKAVHNDQAKG